MRTLADDLLVLSIGRSGRLRCAETLPYGLRGAELADLVAAGRVAVETTGGPIRIAVLDPSPVGDVLLDRAIRWVLREPSPLHPSAFVKRTVGRSPGAHIDHARDLGTVTVDPRRAGRPAPGRIRVVDPAHREAARARVDHVVDSDRPLDALDAQDVVLAALVQAIGLGDRLYAGPVHRRRRRRLDGIAERHWAAVIVRRAVPQPRSGPSLPGSDGHFGGMPPGADAAL
ncbi:GOLPH3/VPS74 family protein [Actinacidiphila sp. ITFR-21]|uniref:GOLPH3/VPS74 family protein n=1 Tax=Actinacidiphila sp. ITFR-21 TaxID=3075199 RepID=UPI002889F671|nr:GPP34 family phosphoprotein [Streptomyces sp. ITFR-21]WNI16134.1 GPP34 family phosphoprotein [Streptomyces sp. ITFR-21]